MEEEIAKHAKSRVTCRRSASPLSPGFVTFIYFFAPGVLCQGYELSGATHLSLAGHLVNYSQQIWGADALLKYLSSGLEP